METIIQNSKVHLGSREFIDPIKLLYLESDVNYTLIHLVDGKKILSSTTLKTIESRLKCFKNFVRINRQSIVNMNLVVTIGHQICILPCNKKLYFSRRRAKNFQKENTLSES